MLNPLMGIPLLSSLGDVEGAFGAADRTLTADRLRQLLGSDLWVGNTFFVLFGDQTSATLLAKDSDLRFLWDRSDRLDASVLKFCGWLANFRRWLNVLRNWRAEAIMNLSIRSERN